MSELESLRAKVAKVEAERGQLWSRVFSALSRAEQIEPQGSPEWVESGNAMRTTVIREVRLTLGKMPMSDEGVARIVDDLDAVLADAPAGEVTPSAGEVHNRLASNCRERPGLPFGNQTCYVCAGGVTPPADAPVEQRAEATGVACTSLGVPCNCTVDCDGLPITPAEGDGRG